MQCQQLLRTSIKGQICLRFSQHQIAKAFITERNLTLERAFSIATAMETAVLESHGSKKATKSSQMEE